MHTLSRWKSWLTDGLFFLLGSVAFALSVAVFAAPHDIVPGGITGIATMLHHLTGGQLPIGLTSTLLNVPLLGLAWWKLGWRMALRTVCATLLANTFTDLFSTYVPPFSGDIMLAAIFGGVLMGIGIGLILGGGGSTGGTEIIAHLLEKKYPHIPIGQLLLLVDGVVVALAVPVFGRLEIAMYAVVLVFITGQITDRLVYGGRRGKMALILCADPDALTEAVTARLGLGVTRLPATGGYSGHQRDMLLCALHREEVVRLKRLVYELDKGAFCMLLTTDEVLGLGWQKLEEE